MSMLDAVRWPRLSLAATALGRRQNHRRQRLSARHQPEHQGRSAAVHRRGHARRRRHARRHRRRPTIKLADPKLCRLEKNTLYPAADGQTTLAIEYQGFRSAATVAVKDAAADRPISFQLDVMPVFMRGGCNTGSCHGAARGKDGFRLSLFGFDPQGDYFRITREIGIAADQPRVAADSLLVEKATGAVPHTGGKRFAADSEYNQTLLRWLEAGAPNDAKPTPAVVGVDLYPPTAVLEGEGATQQFIARARYADGTDRDVTSLATFMSNNDNSAPITADGLVTAAARGEAFVMARFETHTVGNQVLVLPKGLAVHAAADHRQLHRRARRREAEEASHPAERAVQRRGVPAARDDRHHRPVADRATNITPSWPTAATDKRAKLDRSAAGAQGVLRNLGHEVGRSC